MKIKETETQIEDKISLGCINLQLFSDDGQGTGEGEGDNSNGEGTGEVKTYDEKEVQSLIDKRVTEALKTSREKWNKEHEQTLEEKIKETERLAKLSESEKAKELEQKRIAEIESREKELNRKVLELDAVEILSEKGLPTSFKTILLGSDADETLKNINSFEEVFKESVQKAVDERLKGTSPLLNGGKSSKNENSIGKRLAKQSLATDRVVDNPYFK